MTWRLPAPVGTLTLRDCEVGLYLIGQPNQGLDLSVLDAEETARHAAFVREEDRRRYAYAHCVLRHLLAERTGVAPGRLRFGREACCTDGPPHGRPLLIGSGEHWHFSLSHAGEYVAVALGSRRCGVDVEMLVPPGVATELLETLHPDERRQLARLPEPARTRAFTRLWVRKEAHGKGLGVGLGRGLDQVSLLTDPPGWALVDAEPRPGVFLALAVAR